MMSTAAVETPRARASVRYYFLPLLDSVRTREDSVYNFKNILFFSLFHSVFRGTRRVVMHARTHTHTHSHVRTKRRISCLGQLPTLLPPARATNNNEQRKTSRWPRRLECACVYLRGTGFRLTDPPTSMTTDFGCLKTAAAVFLIPSSDNTPHRHPTTIVSFASFSPSSRRFFARSFLKPKTNIVYERREGE